jgi:hypothetical protein
MKKSNPKLLRARFLNNERVMRGIARKVANEFRDVDYIDIGRDELLDVAGAKVAVVHGGRAAEVLVRTRADDDTRVLGQTKTDRRTYSIVIKEVL